LHLALRQESVQRALGDAHAITNAMMDHVRADQLVRLGL